MDSKLQTIIDSAQELTPYEQIELIHAVSQLLFRQYQPAPATTDFWEPKSLEQIIQLQPAPVIQDISTLQVDFWPEEEAVDDFIDYIYQQRTEDRLRDC
jgi:hypothetical protein